MRDGISCEPRGEERKGEAECDGELPVVGIELLACVTLCDLRNGNMGDIPSSW